MLEGLVEPHSSSPYVEVGLSIELQSKTLLSRPKLDMCSNNLSISLYLGLVSFKFSMWIPRKSSIKVETEVFGGVRNQGRNLVYENSDACSSPQGECDLHAFGLIQLNALVLTAGMKGIKVGLQVFGGCMGSVIG